MGSSSSSTIPNGQHTENDVEQKEGFDGISELENITKKAELSINEDKSLPNLIYNFSQLLQKPDLLCFRDIVNTMKTNWKNITECMAALSTEIGEEEAKEMMNIQWDYWSLLLKTKNVMGILIKKCEIQRRGIAVLLDIIRESKEMGGELSDDDKLAHSDCIRKLGKWMDIRELDQLFTEWEGMRIRLQAIKSSWVAKSKQYKAASKYWFWNILKYTGIVLAAAAVIAMVLFGIFVLLAASGSPLITAVGAGGMISKGRTVLPYISIGVGVIAAATYGSYLCWENFNPAHKAYNNAVKITDMIKEMIKHSHEVEMGIYDLKSKSEHVGRELEYLNDVNSVRLMNLSLEKIDSHLSEYINQGEKVIEAVNEACKVYIN